MSEEIKLLKAAEGYKGTKNIRGQLEREASTDGEHSKIIIDRVMKRLANTEKNLSQTGSKFGVAHNPNKQYQTLSLFIKQLRAY